MQHDIEMIDGQGPSDIQGTLQVRLSSPSDAWDDES